MTYKAHVRNGLIVLDEPVKLPEGVELEIAVIPGGDAFFDMLKGIWAAREQAGLTPRTVEEVESQRRRLRNESEQEVLEAGKLQEESRRLREHGKTAPGEHE